MNISGNRIRRSVLVRIVLAAIFSLGAYAGVRCGDLGNPPADPDPALTDLAVRAERTMGRALSAIKSHRRKAGFDAEIDPNGTGLIGPEISPLMTSLGQVEAKRTTANPQMAGLLVRLLRQAGVRPGDTVAIGSSGSFPALLIASIAAAKAMAARPVAILSLGASSFGATDPDFDLLDVYGVLQSAGICDGRPAAVSLGGEKDIGSDFEPEFARRLMEKIRDRGVPIIREGDLVKNVVLRIEAYERAAPGRITAFVNCGGAYGNVGTSQVVLQLKPGLNRDVPLPPAGQRGVLFEMAARKIPVIHLLYIKGLVQEHGLPWDPVPLPDPGASVPARQAGLRFWLICGSYFASLALLALPSRSHRMTWDAISKTR